MSINNISQWVSNLSLSEAAYHPWQVGIVAGVATIAIQVVGKLACYCCKREEPYHSWFFDGREVRLFTEDDEIYFEVIRISDRAKLATKVLVFHPPYDTLTLSAKKISLQSEFEPTGWNHDETPTISPLKTEAVHTWLLEQDQSLCLQSKKDHLFWKYTTDKETHWVEDNLPSNKTLEERIGTIKEHLPAGWNPRNKYPLLIDKPPRFGKWTLGDRQLRIIFIGNYPLWELENTALKTTSLSPLNLKALEHLSLNDRISRFQYQNIDPSSIIKSTTISKIVLTPQYELPSQLDTSLKVTYNKWAATFVDMGTCDFHYSTWGGHAVIIIEGIEDSLPFILGLDFTPIKTKKGFGKVQVIDLNPYEKINYSGKLETHHISKDKAMKILNSARRERDRNEIEPSRFDIHGMNAQVPNPAHNCTSWVRDKLFLAGIIISAGMLAHRYDFPKQYTFFN